MILLSDLVVRYPGTSSNAIHNLSLVIDDSTCILGPHGSGKTSVVLALLGLAPIQQGKIDVDGVEIQKTPLVARKLFSYVPQDNWLPSELTLAEYLTELAVLDDYQPSEVRDRTLWAAHQVHLEAGMGKRLKSFSGGMKRRALIAGSLLSRAPWLIWDEPTLGLDPKEQAHLYQLINQMVTTRRLIITTQVVEDAIAVPGRIILLRHGQLAKATTYSDLAATARNHVFRIPNPMVTEKIREGILWAPMSGGRIKVFADKPEPGWEPLEPTANDGYLWLTANFTEVSLQ